MTSSADARGNLLPRFYEIGRLIPVRIQSSASPIRRTSYAIHRSAWKDNSLPILQDPASLSSTTTCRSPSRRVREIYMLWCWIKMQDLARSEENYPSTHFGE